MVCGKKVRAWRTNRLAGVLAQYHCYKSCPCSFSSSNSFMIRCSYYPHIWLIPAGVGKAGSYSEIHIPSAGTPGSIPPVELKASDAVLHQANQEVLQQL